MTAFKKFDPRAFLERERLAPGSTLATLATLAGLPAKNENHGIASEVVSQFDSGTVAAKSIGIQTDDQTPIHGLGKNQHLTPTPAKIAKVAKVDSSVAATEEDPWSETEEERAAIAEYDGGAPRAWAEALARLDPNNAPAHVPPWRWLRFIDDCGRFLDGGWARQAAAFGWGPLDLFGCDRERPFARIDRAGLLWLLRGRKLVAFTADTATIETPTGAHQTYRRASISYGEATLAWELSPLDGGKPDETPNDGGQLGKLCAYCGRGQLLDDPLLDAAVDGDMFRAHRSCLDLEWQSWRRDPLRRVRQSLPGRPSRNNTITPNDIIGLRPKLGINRERS